MSENHSKIAWIDESHRLAQQVFVLRLAKNLTTASLASRARTSEWKVNRIEAGQANPNYGELVDLAHALGCTVSDLYADLPEAPTPPQGTER